MHGSYEWDERYKVGKDALPWDTGMPAPELVEYFEKTESKPTSALEIGCGTGTNAIAHRSARDRGWFHPRRSTRRSGQSCPTA